MNRVVAKILSDNKKMKIGPIIEGTGIPVPYYPDIRAILSDPEILKKIAREMNKMIGDWKFDIIAGVATGGIPIAVSLSLESGKHFIYIRKKPKEGRAIEGEHQPKQGVLLVDDFLVTSEDEKKFVEYLDQVGLDTKRIFVLMDIGSSNAFKKRREWLAERGIKVSSLITWEEWAEYMKEKKLISAAVADTMIELMNNPPLRKKANKISK